MDRDRPAHPRTRPPVGIPLQRRPACTPDRNMAGRAGESRRSVRVRRRDLGSGNNHLAPSRNRQWRRRADHTCLFGHHPRRRGQRNTGRTQGSWRRSCHRYPPSRRSPRGKLHSTGRHRCRSSSPPAGRWVLRAGPGDHSRHRNHRPHWRRRWWWNSIPPVVDPLERTRQPDRRWSSRPIRPAMVWAGCPGSPYAGSRRRAAGRRSRQGRKPCR